MKPTEQPDCCDVWPKIAARFDWMVLTEYPHLLVLPHIRAGDDGLFVNYCPACGKPARNRVMSKERVDGAQQAQQA